MHTKETNQAVRNVNLLSRLRAIFEKGMFEIHNLVLAELGARNNPRF